MAETEKDTELLDKAKACFKQVVQVDKAQREREIEDLKFQVPEEQWDPVAKRQRMGNDSSAGRPVLSISRIDQPIQLVLNQERSSKLGVKISPLSPDSGVVAATALEGLYRRIERDSKANQARSWGFDRAAKAGRGFWRVNTEWDETTGNPSDQRIVIERIVHQESVYFDPSATKADYSDAEWCFVVTWMPLRTFKREWPDAETGPGDNQEWVDLAQQEPDWTKGNYEDDTAAMLVCEYFYKVHSTEKVVWEDAAGQEQSREKDVVKVHVAKLSGFEVLDNSPTNGQYLPIITCLGRELQPFDEKRRFVGIIGPAKDAQRMYNYAASQCIELAALEPKSPWVGYAGQFSGFENAWKRSNIDNIPFLEANPTSSEHPDQILPLPARAQVDSSRLSISMELLNQADGFLQATTMTFDSSLGRFNDQDRSGKAILAVQEQGEAGTSHYMANLVDAIEYEATVILDLIPYIYDRPGRLAQVVDDEGETETVMLNQPFYKDPETEQPVPLGPNQAPPAPPMAPQGLPQGPGGPPMAPGMGMSTSMPPAPPAPPEVVHYNLREGIYSVAVTVEKKKKTAMKEGAEELSRIIEARPEMLPILGPQLFEYRQYPGSEKTKKDLEKMRDNQFPFLADDDEKPSADQLQAQLNQAGQELEQTKANLQAATQQIQTDEVKNRAMLEKANMDNQTRLQIAREDNQTRLAVEELSGKMDQVLEGLKGGQKAEEAERDREHKTVLLAEEAVLEAGRPVTEEIDGV